MFFSVRPSVFGISYGCYQINRVVILESFHLKVRMKMQHGSEHVLQELK